jgi:hypothetical protein
MKKLDLEPTKPRGVPPVHPLATLPLWMKLRWAALCVWWVVINLGRDPASYKWWRTSQRFGLGDFYDDAEGSRAPRIVHRVGGSAGSAGHPPFPHGDWCHQCSA